MKGQGAPKMPCGEAVPESHKADLPSPKSPRQWGWAYWLCLFSSSFQLPLDHILSLTHLPHDCNLSLPLVHIIARTSLLYAHVLTYNYILQMHPSWDTVQAPLEHSANCHTGSASTSVCLSFLHPLGTGIVVSTSPNWVRCLYTSTLYYAVLCA